MTIEAKHYEEDRQRLMKDPIVIDMANGLTNYIHKNEDGSLSSMGNTLSHADGGPTFEFMQASNAEYHRRGGTGGESIGAIATAILRLVEDVKNETQADTGGQSGSVDA